jgi:hypothetical protein
VLAFLFVLARSAQYSSAPAPSTTDFTLVAYQGQDGLGGDQVQFSHVLGEGKPVVLNFFAGATWSLLSHPAMKSARLASLSCSMLCPFELLRTIDDLGV